MSARRGIKAKLHAGLDVVVAFRRAAAPVIPAPAFITVNRRGAAPEPGDITCNALSPLPYHYRASCNPAPPQTLQRLDRAVFLLSQTATGRALLSQAYQRGVALQFDPPLMQRWRANGLASKVDRLVLLSDRLRPEEMALTLAHELGHFAQYAGAPQIQKGQLYGPYRHGLGYVYAVEGDAHAHEAVVAFELYNGHSGVAGHHDRFRSYELAAALAHKHGMALYRLIDHYSTAQPDKKGGKWNDAVAMIALAGFMSFYDNPRRRGFYELNSLSLKEKLKNYYDFAKDRRGTLRAAWDVARYMAVTAAGFAATQLRYRLAGVDAARLDQNFSGHLSRELHVNNIKYLSPEHLRRHGMDEDLSAPYFTGYSGAGIEKLSKIFGGAAAHSLPPVQRYQFSADDSRLRRFVSRLGLKSD